jgi:hypothetical protein
VYAGTLRELSIRIRGALWRQRQAIQLSRRAAWHTAMLTRVAAADFPDLDEFAPSEGAASARMATTPEAVEALMRDWAAERGLKVERHERPVI